MNILVTGADGQLGKCLFNVGIAFPTSHTITYANRETLDITNRKQVMQFVKENYIDLILNFAAYTNVEKAETDYCAAFSANVLGPLYLAEAINQTDGVLIHISTDYVYSPYPGWCGQPFTERDDFGLPTSVYGITKRFGEMAVKNSKCRHIIIRTSWLYSSYGNNFLTKVCNLLENNIGKDDLKFVSDQIGTPTSARGLALFITNLIESKEYELVEMASEGITINYSDNGACSWYDFAKFIRETASRITQKSYPNIVPCKSSDFPSKVKRPYFSVMSKEKLYDTFEGALPVSRDWTDNVVSELYFLKDKGVLK